MSTQQRIKRCGLCREHGHNKRTCPSKHVTMRSEEREQTMSMKKETNTECEVNDNTCAICFDNCGKCRTTLECGHTFDTKCIFKWLSKNKSCPCCRANVCELATDNQETGLPGLIVVDQTYSMYGSALEQYSGKELVYQWYRALLVSDLV